MLKLLKDWSLRVWYRRRVVGRGAEHVRRVLVQGQGAQHGLWLSGTQTIPLLLFFSLLYVQEVVIHFIK